MPSILLGSSHLSLTANIYYLLFCARHGLWGRGTAHAASLLELMVLQTKLAKPTPKASRAGAGAQVEASHQTLKYCKVLNQANNCSIKDVLFSYFDKYVFIVTWKARF